jgi:hypothetical protein
MARALSLADAEKLLTGKSTLERLLDQFTGLLGLPAMLIPQVGVALNILSFCQDLVPGLQSLLDRSAEKLRRATKHDRDEILTAVHTIVVISAYFEALAETDESARIFKFTRDDQIGLARGLWEDEIAEMGYFVSELLCAAIPAPSPYDSYHATIGRIVGMYHQLSDELGKFVQGLAPWDSLSETAQDRLLTSLHQVVPEAAKEKYESRLRALAADHIDFTLWLSLREILATSGEIRNVSRSLADVHDLLLGMSAGTSELEGIRLDLSLAHTGAVSRMLVENESSAAPSGPRIPIIDTAYIDPAFRIAVVGPASRPADEDWWNEQGPVRQDLAGLLAAHLTSADATELPLVVLGHPGAGKSLLTKVLAARVPAALFPPVRVELRRVNSNAPVRRQIEEGLVTLTNDSLSWSDVAKAATKAGAVPVVLLDGFDELLQNTGVSQSDYLEQVREFQRVESELKRPVAIVVTSRTAVAHQMRFPTGCPVVKLEGFDKPRITRWLELWNQANSEFFEAKTLTRMEYGKLRHVLDLAEQPLLLLMLALYDFDGNALQGTAEIGQAALYEGLLRRFIRREVEKDQQGRRLTPAQMDKTIEKRMTQLAIVAFAMFNRRSQSVRVRDLNKDLGTLIGVLGPGHEEPLALDDADVVAGRFFFIHEAQADAGALRSYEFLHATFGEYFIARESIQMLKAIADTRKAAHGYPTTSIAEPRLRALLSFAPLSGRQSIRHFSMQLADGLPAEQRSDLLESILALVHSSLSRPAGHELDKYLPAARDLPFQHALYSLNLVLLALCFADGSIELTDLFSEPDSSAATARWSYLAALWRAALNEAEWNEAAADFSLTVDPERQVSRSVAFRDAESVEAQGAVQAAGYESVPMILSGFENLALLTDPGLDLLLGLSVPLQRFPYTLSISMTDNLQWPFSRAGNIVGRAFYELALSTPGSQFDAFRNFSHCINSLAGSHQQEAREISSIIVRALTSWQDRLSVREIAVIIMSFDSALGRLGRSAQPWLTDVRLTLLECAIASLHRFRNATSDVSTGIGKNILQSMNILIKRNVDLGSPHQKAALLALLDSSGIPWNEFPWRTSSSALLPDEDDTAEIAVEDPQLFTKLIRAAWNVGSTEWLSSTVMAVLERSPDTVLLYLTEDILDLLGATDEIRLRRNAARVRMFNPLLEGPEQ